MQLQGIHQALIEETGRRVTRVTDVSFIEFDSSPLFWYFQNK